MNIPFLYPEPHNCKLSIGTTVIAHKLQLSAEKKITDNWPDLPECIANILDAEASVVMHETGGIRLKELEPADIRFINEYFKRDYSFEKVKEDAYLISVNKGSFSIASRSREGFCNAFKTIKQMIVKIDADKSKHIKNGVIFDYSHKKIRAVHLSFTGPAEDSLLEKLLAGISELKYNTVYIENISNMEEINQDSIKKLGSKYMLDIVFYNSESYPGMPLVLDGMSILAWEHISRREGVNGGTVSYRGKPDLEEMIRERFMFNLVYSAEVLWSENYNNFSWEKVSELAREKAYFLTAALMGIKPVSLYNDCADVYPVQLFFEYERYRSSPVRKVCSGNTAQIASVVGQADSIVFFHAIRLNAPDDIPAATVEDADSLGFYTVLYNDGTKEEIQLRINQNISFDNAWWMHRLNPFTHKFDTDGNLQQSCCLTMPIRRITQDSKPITVYRYEWNNPRPEKRVKQINLTVKDNYNLFSIYVYGIEVAVV